MLSSKYYAQLLNDIKSAHNANPPSESEFPIDLIDGESNDQHLYYTLEEERPYTEIDELEVEMTEEEILAEDDEEEQKMIEQLENMKEYMEFEEEENDYFGTIIGLDPSIFPSADQYSTEQLEEILKGFLLMLRSHRVQVYLPKKMTIEKKYELSITILNEAIYLNTYGNTEWKRCTADSKNCPYDEHCQCKAIEHITEQEKAYAKSKIRSISSCVKEKIKEGKYFKYEVDHNLDVGFSEMHMYIADGISHIPTEIIYYQQRWNDLKVVLARYFKNYPSLASLFGPIDDIYKERANLIHFLDLTCILTGSTNVFQIEPFYIDDDFIVKGYKSPEINLKFDIKDNDNPPDNNDNDIDLPF